MGRARIAYDNKVWASGVTLEASSEASGYPLGALLSPDRSKLWQSTVGAVDQTLTITWASAQTIKVVAAVNATLHTNGGTLKAEYWTGAAWAAFGGGTGVFPTIDTLTRVTALWHAAGVNTTKIRLSFLQPGSAQTVAVALGVAFAGSYFEPTFTVLRDGRTGDRHDPSRRREALDGQRRTWRRTKYFDFSTRFHLTATELDTAHAVFDAIGNGTPCIYATDPSTMAKHFFGYFPDRLRTVFKAGDRWEVDLPFQEAR